MSLVWPAVLSVHCSLVVTCWEMANLLTLLYVMCSCVFVTFPCGLMGQVWYLIVLFVCVFVWLDSLRTSQQFSSYVGTYLPGLNQY